MANKFKVLPFIGQLKGNQTAIVVSQQLESVINKQTSEGWEFVEVSNVTIEVKPGCLASLLGSKTSYIRYDQIIFKRSS